MADCFPPTPVNPLNELLLGAFGNNFFPPYSAGFQPINRAALTDEKTLQNVWPGGGKTKPPGDPKHAHLSEVLTPVTNTIGAVFTFFGPLFIILDLIRAIIDVLCALFNPEPVIASIVEMFITVVPPAIALYPPLSSILLALNIAKLITAIVVSLTSAIIPIIDLLVENALSITSLLNDGNIGAIESVTSKICVLLETFANELGAFAPIGFIIEILDIFMNLGARFFCASDAACCNSEVCPEIILDPPSGTGTIIEVRSQVTLGDLLAPINPLQLPDILSPPITIPLNDLSLGTLDDINIGPVEFPPIDLVPIADDDLNGFVIVEAEMAIRLDTDVSALRAYIVDPDKIPGASSEEDPATIRILLTNSDTQEEITARVISVDENDGTVIRVRADNFSIDDEIQYEIQPDKISLLKLNLIELFALL
jgi:hypothetical protein